MYRQAVAITAVFTAMCIAGPADVAHQYELDAIEKEVRPARVMSMPARETWWTMLEPSGNPATLKDCGSWARLTINFDPCYSDQPCGLRRICYGDASTWVQL